MTSIGGSIVGTKGGCEDVDKALDLERLGGNNGGMAGSSAIEGSS